MGSVAAAISRNRQQSQTQNVYNADLENTQQGYADALYGQGAPIGSYGQRGGAYPTANKDPSGFGTGTWGYPGQYPGADPTGQQGAGNIYPGGSGNPNDPNASTLNPNGATYPGFRGVPNGDPTNPANGGSFQWGPGGASSGMGDYSAMQPYQWGSGGAQGDLNASGAAAYSGYGSLGRQYAQLGRQGVTQGERSNLMAASNEAVQSNLAANRDQIANRAAQSGNTAGVAGAQARLGATSGQQLETADRANQTAILQENQRRKEAGLTGQAGAVAGQAGLYNAGTGYVTGLLGGRSRLASLQQRGYTQGAGTGGTVSGSASFGG